MADGVWLHGPGTDFATGETETEDIEDLDDLHITVTTQQLSEF